MMSALLFNGIKMRLNLMFSYIALGYYFIMALINFTVSPINLFPYASIGVIILMSIGYYLDRKESGE